MYHSFGRIITDIMLTCEAYNHMPNDNDLELDYDACEWDPIMGEIDDYPETDDEWLDDFQGEEDFA